MSDPLAQENWQLAWQRAYDAALDFQTRLADAEVTLARVHETLRKLSEEISVIANGYTMNGQARASLLGIAKRCITLDSAPPRMKTPEQLEKEYGNLPW